MLMLLITADNADFEKAVGLGVPKPHDIMMRPT